MLRGEKVALRALEREDLKRWWELRNDEEVERLSFGPATPRSLAEIEARFDKHLAAEHRDYENLVVEVDGEMIGSCRVFQIAEYNRNCHLGISLAREHWGKGYGTDAMRVLVDYCFHDLNLHKVGLTALASNERAIRAYVRSGFVEEGRLRGEEWTRGHYEDLVVMGITREDWEAALPGPSPAS
jgi:RimJ/RimL family protein N-acetyltransferase